MATQVSGSIQAACYLTATQTSNVSGISSTLPVNLPSLINETYTSGNNAADKLTQLYCDTRTLANGATEDLDMYVLSAVDLVGNAMTTTKVKFIYIKNNSTTEADYITIGGKGSTAGWTSFLPVNTYTMKLTGGGVFVLHQPGATGYAVGASTTNHLLTITASAVTSLTYTIVVAGTVS